MKNRRLCPKCQSNYIARIEGRADGFGSGNNIMIGALVTRYICLNCGFLEEWLEANELEKIRRQYGGQFIHPPYIPW